MIVHILLKYKKQDCCAKKRINYLMNALFLKNRRDKNLLKRGKMLSYYLMIPFNFSFQIEKTGHP